MDSYYLYIDEAYKGDFIIISALLTSYPSELKDFPINFHCNDKYEENISLFREYVKNKELNSSLTLIYSEKGKSLTLKEYITLYFLLPVTLNNLLIPQASTLTILVDALDDRIKDYKLNLNVVKSIIGRYTNVKVYIPSPISRFLSEKGKIHKKGLLFVDCSSTSLAKGCNIILEGKFKKGIKKFHIDTRGLESIVQTLSEA